MVLCLLILFTYIRLCRDASYTTQPLELLNALGIESGKSRLVMARDLEVPANDNSPSANGKRLDLHMCVLEEAKCLGWVTVQKGFRLKWVFSFIQIIPCCYFNNNLFFELIKWAVFFE